MNQSATAQANVAVNVANFELNKGDDFIVALDISGSMQATDCPANLTRLTYSLEQFSTFVKEASKWDTDGVSLYAFGHQVHTYPDVEVDKLEGVINQLKSKPFEGATMTHLVVQAAFAEHKARQNEQTVLFIFTDGEPSDQEALFKTIADITHEVKDEREFNIGFVTVGQRSAALSIAMRLVKETYQKGSKRTEQDAINAFITPDLLILDEIGVQHGTDTERNILFEIVNSRYEQMKPTILISNLDIKGLVDYAGERTIDRMRENGGIMRVFNWESYRETRNLK